MRQGHPRANSDPKRAPTTFPLVIPPNSSIANQSASPNSTAASPNSTAASPTTAASPISASSIKWSDHGAAATSSSIYDGHPTSNAPSAGSTPLRSRSSSFGPSPPSSAASNQVLTGVVPFRRHHRQRSSTIFVAPRSAPPVSLTGAIPVPNGLVRGVTTLAFAQMLAKLLAFALNQLLYRFLGARDLGAANQLDLLVSTALVLSRDAIRLASQRQTVASVPRASNYTTDARAMLGTLIGAYQETSNLGWLSVGLGWLIVTLISAVMYFRQTWDSSVLAVASAASLLELVSEPGFLVLQLKIQLAKRARAETMANTVRVLVVAVSLLFFRVNAFMGFACGHLGYSLTLTAFIYHATNQEALNDGFSLLPTKVWNGADQTKLIFISDQAWRTSLELGAQQVVKFLLTEGDKLAVGVMTTLEQQGEYALAANYGSLLARMVFSPVEEALRSYFSRARNSSSATAPSPTQIAEEPTEPKHGDPETQGEMVMVLSSVLRAYAYLGIFAAGFGPLAANFVIAFLVRRDKFSSAGDVLAAYAYYIPILAWNGVLESLVQSTAPLNVLRWQGSALAGITLLFVVLTYVFVSCLHWGGAGIVWAQLATMLLRIAWCLRYCQNYFAHSGGSSKESKWFTRCLPNVYVWGTSVLTVGSARVFMPKGVDSLRSLLVLMSIAVTTAVPILVTESRLIKQLASKLKSKRKTQ